MTDLHKHYTALRLFTTKKEIGTGRKRPGKDSIYATEDSTEICKKTKTNPQKVKKEARKAVEKNDNKI